MYVIYVVYETHVTHEMYPDVERGPGEECGGRYCANASNGSLTQMGGDWPRERFVHQNLWRQVDKKPNDQI